jgi:hypothetical protein
VSEESKNMPIQDITKSMLTRMEPQFIEKTAHLVPENIPSLKQSLKEFYTHFFEETRTYFRITNAIPPLGDHTYYEVKITKELIRFELKSPTKKDVYTYSFETGILTLNEVVQDDTCFLTFLKYLKKMSSEIHTNQADVFESHTQNS